jgi:hypothetical protein
MFNQIPLAGGGLSYALTDKATSATAAGGPTTFSFTVQFGPEDPDRYLICVSSFGGANAAPTSCTIGGVAATLAAADAPGDLTRRAQIWIAHVPDGASGSVVLSGPGANGCGMLLYSVYPMLDPTVHDTLTEPGGTLTIPSGGIGFGGCMDSVGTSSPLDITWSGLVEDDAVTWTVATSIHRLSAASLGDIDAAVTVSATGSSGTDLGFACASFGL